MEERIENLQRIIKNILASTDDQIQGDLKDSLRLRMSVSENLHGEVRYLKCLRALVEEKFQEFFKKKNFPKDYNDFVGIWSSLSEEAKSLCNDPKYDYDEEKYNLENISDTQSTAISQSIYEIVQSIITGFKRISNYTILKKLLLFFS